MDAGAKELRKLRGVGDVLAARFMEAGLVSFDKIVSAGEDGLKGIKGINPRAIPSILSQAAEMADAAAQERLRELRGIAVEVGDKVRDIAADVRSRFSEEITGPAGKKLEKDLLRIIGSLESATAKLEAGSRKAGKVIVKFEKRLSSLEGAGFKEIRKGLKKTRKMLKRSGYMEKTGKQRI